MPVWRPSCAVIVGLVLAAACSGATPAEDGEGSRVPASPSPATLVGEGGTAASDGAEGSGASLPDPNAVLPRDPALIAARLTQTVRALNDAIDEWRSSGGTGEWPPPRGVVRLALDQQRIYQVLAGMGKSRLDATVRRLASDVRPAARDASLAAVRLAEGLAGVVVDEPIEMRTRAPMPADTLRAYYERASRRFDVPWTLLAAVHFIETKFGRVVSPSWAGAQGPMQFLPSTWESFGMGGDIYDTRDAILGAANYLAATGSPGDDRAALWAYNPVDYYGDVVLAYDRLMRRDVRNFYALYNWQVFVRARSGLVQLTGPGADVG
jgi:soluble lytic murein transglycosylase-like protein